MYDFQKMKNIQNIKNRIKIKYSTKNFYIRMIIFTFFEFFV